MISFDLEIFCIQLVIFILFLIFTARFIVKPVMKMAEKRRDMLLSEKGTAEKAENKVIDHREIYESEINSTHKEGASAIKQLREKALAERADIAKEAKIRIERFLSSNRIKVKESGKILQESLLEKEPEMASLICEKLWGIE